MAPLIGAIVLKTRKRMGIWDILYIRKYGCCPSPPEMEVR